MIFLTLEIQKYIVKNNQILKLYRLKNKIYKKIHI